MSGGIYLTGRSYWSCAGWLFDLALSVLASTVTSQSSAALVRETIASDVGVLVMAALPDVTRDDLLRAIQDDLYDAVVHELKRAERVDTAEMLRHVHSLVLLAQDAS